MVDARGNHKAIEQFLGSIPAADRERALTLVESLSVKDRSDVPLSILEDHFTAPASDSPLYADYILSPRIDNEALAPCRQTARQSGRSRQPDCTGDHHSSRLVSGQHTHES